MILHFKFICGIIYIEQARETESIQLSRPKQKKGKNMTETENKIIDSALPTEAAESETKEITPAEEIGEESAGEEKFTNAPSENQSAKARTVEASPSARQGLYEELRMLGELIPEADIRELDNTAWEALLGGESLLIAYLGSAKRQREAEEKNKENAASTPGDVKSSANTLYSIDEIKQMPRPFVKKNLDKILKSLEKN